MYEDLRRLEGGIRYFSPNQFDFNLQGDAFDGAPYVVIGSTAVSERSTRVMLLSNTCDMAPENLRDTPLRVAVAPIVRLERFREIFIAEGMPQDAVDEKVAAVRAHRVSKIFFLPRGSGIAEDSVVMFDSIQTMPIDRFEAAHPQKLATLSDRAFWLLAVKLSIHFCRLQEGVARQAA